ncbi:hypothetical protein TSUD_141450 [Trifolium subterraneum]|uniref:Uncharacterized protein n=1 Tax=Trifolium subterraneum TaxID=3900 RepID=A0A2Z6P0X1_TRISU|nr:hypothetical protein TSUD_141450 [Trifolium subterraneum]
MGNNLQGFNRLNKGHFPNYHEQLRSYGAIDVTKIEHEAINGHTGELFDISKWNATYTIESSKCILDLRRVSNKDGKVSSVSFQISDEMYPDGNIWFAVGKDTSFLASSTSPLLLNGGFKNCKQKNNMTTNTLGYVIETCSYLYGSGSKRGFLVLEEIRKIGDNENPRKVTVAHYYTVSSRNIFSHKIDIGLSVIVRIQQSSEVGFDITVQGPVQHPSRALHSMFNEVMKTGIWKPTKCPHCASMDVGDDSDMQSEIEDCDDFLPPRVYDLSQNVKSIISNNGAVRGNYNGNLYVNKIYLKR